MKRAVRSLLVVLLAASVRGENFGLRDPQPAELLPKSKAPPQTPVRKARASGVPAAERLARTEEGWRLAAGWHLIEADAVWPGPAALFDPALDIGACHPSTVPGTVLTTLV